MNDPIKTISYKAHTIEVYPDTDPLDPREDYDNLGTILTTRYWNELNLSRDEILDYVEEVKRENGIVLPIYAYDHTIVRFRTRDFSDAGLPQGHYRFDSFQAGFIVVKLDKIREWFRVKRVTKKVREQAIKNLAGEIETIDQYSSGQVYGYKLIEDKTGEEIDSCWGFYELDYMIDEVKGHVDYIMRKPHTRAPVMELLGA